MKKTIALILFVALTLSMLSGGSVYLDSGISISKGDRAFVFQDIENPSPSIEYLVMNLPFEGGYRNTFSNGIAISLSLGAYFNVYEKIGTTTTDNRDFYPTSFSFKAMAGYGLEICEKARAEILGGISTLLGFKKHMEDQTLVFSTFALTGEAGIWYEVTDSLSLRTGAKLGFPFSTSVKTYRDFDEGFSYALQGSMIGITPFIGVAYSFK